MTQPDTPLPSDAAIEEADRRTGFGKNSVSTYYALESYACELRKVAASLIEKHEPETLVDAETRAAREYVAERNPYAANSIRSGKWDDASCEIAAFRAGAAWQRETGNG